MMSSHNMGLWIHGNLVRRKNPKPDPLFSVIWIFSLQSVRQLDPGEVILSIPLMDCSDLLQMISENWLQFLREDSLTILLSLSHANDDDTPAEIKVLYP